MLLSTPPPLNLNLSFCPLPPIFDEFTQRVNIKREKHQYLFLLSECVGVLAGFTWDLISSCVSTFSHHFDHHLLWLIDQPKMTIRQTLISYTPVNFSQFHPMKSERQKHVDKYICIYNYFFSLNINNYLTA